METPTTSPSGLLPRLVRLCSNCTHGGREVNGHVRCLHPHWDEIGEPRDSEYRLIASDFAQECSDYERSDRPQRVQRSRRAGSKMPPNTVVVSRPSKWGNPYKLGSFVPGLGTLNTMADVVEAYRRYITRKLSEDTPSAAGLRMDMEINLKGKHLACWCPLDQPCHADVLLELSNAKNQTPPPMA